MYQASSISAPGSIQSVAAQSIGVAQSRPELMDYMEKLVAAISYGEELASQLQARLSGVMSPPSPCGDNCAKAHGPVTYYGQQLDAAIERVAGVNASMKNMLDRLQA